MDKSSDSSSDSDSNSSTSWVFVEDATISHQTASNTFHLDCSREPIQELTEQDLMSAGSDFESDTDGISVISESEVPTDDSCPNIQSSNCSNESIEVVGETSAVYYDYDTNIAHIDELATSDTPLVVVPKIELTKIFKPLHMLGIGVVVTAMFLASYNHITTKVSEENVDNFNHVEGVSSYNKIEANDDVSYDKIDLPPCDDLNKLYTKTDLNEELEQIVDITMTCAFRHKPRNDFIHKQIKKCVKREYKTKKTGYSKNPESIHNEMESVGDHAKYGGDKSEDILSSFKEDVKKSIDASFKGDIKHKYNKKKNGEMNYNKNQIDELVCNIESGERYKPKKKERDQVEEFERYEKDKNKKLKHNHKKHSSQEKFKEDHRHNTQFENHEHLSKTKRPYKHQKDKKQHNDCKNKKLSYRNNKKHELKHHFHRNFNKAQMNSEIFVKYKDEDNEYHFKEVSHKGAKIREANYRDKIKQDKRNSTTSGEWYINLHKARNQIRKQEHVSDWVFDRAHGRSKKRNKAQWYFKWMNIREQLRYKQSYKPYSS